MQNSNCFEYVLGTLRGGEREVFIKQLRHDRQLQADVSFWEEHLMEMQDLQAQLAPQKDSWQLISQRINTPPPAARSQSRTSGSGWRWALPALCATFLLAALIVYRPAPEPTVPNTDYVAVLTDHQGNALLTALTTGEGQKMWLKWEDITLADEASAQLWAVSRRDGGVRPIAVFDSSDVVQMPLSDARWRLIQDAEYLLLTEEEPGGSALDEPSDKLLAKGVCVRFTAQKSG